MILPVKASYLEVAPVLSETQTKDSVFNQVVFLHHIVNRSHLPLRSVPGQTKYAICCLRIEQMSLSSDTTECEIKRVYIRMVVVTKMELVIN